MAGLTIEGARLRPLLAGGNSVVLDPARLARLSVGDPVVIAASRRSS